MTTKVSPYVWNCSFFVLLFCFNVCYRPSHPLFFTYWEPYLYKLNPFYAASHIERFTLEQSVALNYHLSGTIPTDPTKENTLPPKGCELWRQSTFYISDTLQAFKKEMALYNQLLQNHPGVLDGDMRERSTSNTSCLDLQIHPHGLGGVFTSGSLSRSSTGLLEPVYPPFASLATTCSRLYWWRSHDELGFLVHDFPTICQSLKPTSKIILVDVGYDVSSKWTTQNDFPTLSLLRQYKKFGFPVDAVYVFDSLSSKSKQYQPWTSQTHQVVDWDSDSRSLQEFTWKDPDSQRINHPWDWIAHNLEMDDLVLVTLHLPPRGVDPTEEMHWLEEIPSSPVAQTIDALYFHPRVYMAEDEPIPSRKNTETDQGNENFRWTVRDALRFYTKLRETGIQAHAFVS